MPQRATCASVVHTFWPLTTYSSPSRTARVVSDERSLPAPGSLNSWHHSSEPSSRPGSQRRCCSSVPATSNVGPAQPIPMGLSGRGTPSSRIASSSSSCSAAPAPRPQGSGQCGETNPARARREFHPAGNRPPGACSATKARNRPAGESVLGWVTCANLFHPPVRPAPNSRARRHAGPTAAPARDDGAWFRSNGSACTCTSRSARPGATTATSRPGPTAAI